MKKVLASEKESRKLLVQREKLKRNLVKNKLWRSYKNGKKPFRNLRAPVREFIHDKWSRGDVVAHPKITESSSRDEIKAIRMIYYQF